MRISTQATVLLAAITFSLSSAAQTINKIKVKTFVDKVGVDHSPYMFNAITTADNGAIVGLYPSIQSQPDWIKEKKGFTTTTAIHTWDRTKATRQVKSEPYLVYGRDKAEPMGLMRLGDKTYLIAYQGKTAGGSAVVHSRLKGSGISASPCTELVQGDLTMNLHERPTNKGKRGMYHGVTTYSSESGENGLVALVGDITMNGTQANIALVAVDKEMNVLWTEAYQLANAGEEAQILDVAMLGEDDALVLVSVTTKGGKQLRLYKRSSKDFMELDFEEDVVQDAEMNVTGTTVSIGGIYGKASDKDDRSFGGFHLSVDASELEIVSFNDDKFSEPTKQTVLAGVDFTADGKCYVTAASYIYEGTKAGAGGEQLKNIVYHCSGLNIFHFNANGSHARTTLFPMANAGSSVLEILPATMVFQDDLIMFYNEDPANNDKRKKGGEMKPEKAKGDVAAQYTQLTFEGKNYSRLFLKEDSEVRSILPLRTWQLSDSELFFMGMVNPKNPTFYPIKLQLTPGSS